MFTQLYRVLSYFVIAMLLTLPSFAQISISDNDLRDNINAFNKRVQIAQQLIANLENSLNTLQSENDQLRLLVHEINEIILVAVNQNAKREILMGEINQKVETNLIKLTKQQIATLAQIRQVVDLSDSSNYTNALLMYNNNGDVTGALQALRKIQALGNLSSYGVAATYWIGRIQFEQGQFDKAEVTLSNLLNSNPGHLREADTLFVLSEIDSLLGEKNTSVWKEKILRFHPTSLAADKIRTLYDIP